MTLRPPIVDIMMQRACPAVMFSSLPAIAGNERVVAQLTREIAVQVDLASAICVLEQGLERLTGSSDAMCILVVPSVGLVTAGDEPRAINDHVQGLVAQVASTGTRMFLGRVVIEPVGLAPARAVVIVRRPVTGAAFHQAELATIAAIAASLAGILERFPVLPARTHIVSLDRFLAHAPRAARVTKWRRSLTPRWAYPALLGVFATLVAVCVAYP